MKKIQVLCLFLMLSEAILANPVSFPKQTFFSEKFLKKNLEKIKISDTANKPVDSINYTYDTLRTLCTYMINFNTGESPTGYLIRIRKYKMDFVPPTADEFKKDSFIVKKQKVIANITYYMAISINDIVKKGEKPKQHLEYTTIPNGMVIKDYDGNLDQVWQQIKKNLVPIPEDSISKKKLTNKKK